jgi:uncharacterized protein (DUF1330 family)
MAKGYVIINEDIKDPEGMKAYMALAGPTLAGATVLVYDTNPQVVEGNQGATQTIVLEFPSVDEAKAWYNSDAYQEAVKLRLAAADCSGVIVSGM